jgi:GNAT superfamily N-acetyltransferase
VDDDTQTQFRRATRQDAASIWRVRTRAIEAIPQSYYDEQDIARWARAGMPDAFEDVIVSSNVVVAEQDRQIIGWGLLDKSASQVEAVFVHPDSQRRGVASRILAIIEVIACSTGVRSLTLSSTLNAVPFYEHAGFQRHSRTKYHHPDGFDLDCVVMVKELDASVRPA